MFAVIPRGVGLNFSRSFFTIMKASQLFLPLAGLLGWLHP